MTRTDESELEMAAMEWLQEMPLKWGFAHGPDIGPGGEVQERDSWEQVVLVGRLRDALARINPGVPANVLEDVIRKITRPESVDLLQANREFHAMLVDGIDAVWYADGRLGQVHAVEDR